MKTPLTGKSPTQKEEMVFSRKPRNSLFFVMLRSLLSCSPTPTNSMSTLAPPRRTCTIYVSLKVFLFFFFDLAVFVDAAIWNLNNGTVRVGFIIMTRTKKIYDQYQKALGIDLWSAQYEVNISLICLSSSVWSIFKGFCLWGLQKMQEQLRKLKDINHKLKKEIR